MARRRKTKPVRRAWQPMQRVAPNPAYIASSFPDGIPDGWLVEVWANDVYQLHASTNPQGFTYLSVKRHDRHAIRDWRHLQAIKNEVCDPEREGFELFPAESRLVDEANQYHLWVLPAGERMPVGQRDRVVNDADAIRAHNVETGGAGRQRSWQPGLPTGLLPEGET